MLLKYYRDDTSIKVGRPCIVLVTTVRRQLLYSGLFGIKGTFLCIIILVLGLRFFPDRLSLETYLIQGNLYGNKNYNMNGL